MTPKTKRLLQKPTRVLIIVDDVHSIRELHKHLLTNMGFKSIELAADGKQALEMLNQAEQNGKAFGLVISDWEMPTMNGIELLKAVRISKNLWRTPLYLLTGIVDRNKIIEAITLGVTGYITKPISPKMFDLKFRDYL